MRCIATSPHYPEPLRSELRHGVEDYVRNEIEEAWPTQQRGEIPTSGVGYATTIQNRLTSFEPASPGDEILHAEAFKQFNRFIELRRARLNAVSTSLPEPLWWVLGLGALINLLLISMLAVDRIAAHLLVSGMFAVFVAMMIFLIVAMDHPFLGQLSVGPDAFRTLQETLLGR